MKTAEQIARMPDRFERIREAERLSTEDHFIEADDAHLYFFEDGSAMYWSPFDGRIKAFSLTFSEVKNGK